MKSHDCIAAAACVVVRDAHIAVDDRALLAEFSAKAYESDAIKKMRID